MPEASQIIRLRERRRGHPKTGLLLSLGGSAFLSLSIAFLFIFCAIAFITLIVNLPSPDSLVSLMDVDEGLLNNPTQLLDRSGEQVIATLRHPAASTATYLYVPEDLFTIDRPRRVSSNNETIPIFSPDLISATIATADPAFWQHAGFAFAGINDDRHPTLAQQLVSDLLLWDEPPSLSRALRERFLAAQITNRYGRAQILEWYLNSVQYGKLIYGADAAAQAYYGKSASSINLTEAVWLAVLAKNPNLPPTPEDYESVLHDLQTSGWISPDEADRARSTGPAPTLTSSAYTSIAPGFTDFILEHLGDSYNLERIRRGGLKSPRL